MREIRLSKILWLWFFAIAIILIVVVITQSLKHAGNVNTKQIKAFEKNLNAPNPYLHSRQSISGTAPKDFLQYQSSISEFAVSNEQYKRILKNIMDNSDNVSDIIDAAGVLARQGDNKAKEYLIKMLKSSPSNGITIVVATRLAQAGDLMGYKKVADIAEKGDWGSRIYAGRALGYFGTKGIETLKSIHNSKDGWIRYGADAGLARLGDDEAMKELIGGLSHYDPAVRIFCAESLAHMHNPDAIPYLEHEFNAQDPYEKYHGAKYLYILDNDARAKAYLEHIASSNSPQKDDAIITLANQAIGK